MTTKTAKAIGIQLRKVRENKKLSLRDVEEFTGIEYVGIGRIERGANKASFENIIRLCKFYGIRLNDLANCAVTTTSGRII